MSGSGEEVRKGMRWTTRAGLVLALSFSLFVLHAICGVGAVHAAVNTYYVEANAAVNVGVDGSINMTTLADLTVTGGASNQNRAYTNTTAPTGTTRWRIGEGANDTRTGQEFFRAYTPTYAASTAIAANATAYADFYMRGTGTSVTAKATLYEYNDTTGIVGAAKGTASFTGNAASTTRQTMNNVSFANAAFTVAAGNRLMVIFAFDMSNCRPAYLWGQGASATPSGYQSFTVNESVCTRTAPTVTFNPASGNVNPGGNVPYTVTITNNDTAACSNSTFTLSIPSETGTAGNFVLPSTISATTPSPCALAPGGTCTATLTVTAQAAATAGATNTTTINAADGTNHAALTGSGNVTTTVNCVRSAPTVTFAPASGSVAPGGNVPYTVTITNKDTAGCSNSTFTLSIASETGTAANFVLPSTISASTPSPCTLAPSGTCTATLTVTSQAGATAGATDTTTINAADATNHAAQTGSGPVTTTINCVRSAPTVTFAPTSGNVFPGTNVPYTVTVTNKDGVGCSNSTFTLSIASETGAAANFVLPSTLSATAPNPCTLAPNATCTATLTVTAQAGATGGATNTATINAADGTNHGALTGSGNVITTVLASNAMIVYSINTTMPQYRMYSSSADIFNSQSATLTNATPTFIVTKASPKRNEKMVGYVTTGGVLYIIRWNGASWSNEWNVNVGGAGVNGRRFDIAYEQVTGDAIVVYSNNTSGANELRYRIWNGTSWTAATNLDSARLTGVPNYIRMASRPGSDQIALAVADAGNLLTALIWSGSAWGNEPGTAALESNLYRSAAAGDVPSFDVAFESSSGDVLVVNSINAANGLKYHQFTGGAWTTTTNTTGSANNAFGAVTLSANLDTASNQILLALTDNVGAFGANALYETIWSGTGWSAVSQTGTLSANYAVNRLPMAGGWLTSGATTAAVVVYDGSTLNTINYVYSTNGGTSWTAATGGVTVPAAGRWWWDVEMDPVNADTMMVTFSDNNADLWAKRLVLSAGPTFTWTNSDGGTAESTTLTNTTTQNFSFAYDQNFCTRNAPSVTVAPASGSVNPGAGQAYTVTVTNNDRVACSSSTFTLSVASETGTSADFVLPSTLSATTPSPCTLAPGGTCTATLTVNAQAGATAGTTNTTAINAADGTNHAALTGSGNVATTVNCVRSAPTVTFNPTSSNVGPGGNVPYTVTITNKDRAGCSNSTFTLSIASETGTAANFVLPSTLSATSPSPCTLAPNGTCTATLTVTAQAGATAGAANTTTINAADATNHSAQTGSGPVTTTVACARANPTVSITPATQNVFPGDLVSYTVSVKNNDNAACTATTFTLSKTDNPVPPTADFSASTLTSTSTGSLAPGATYTTTLTHTSATGAVVGATEVTSVTTAADANHASVTSNTATTTVLASNAMLVYSINTTTPQYRMYSSPADAFDSQTATLANAIPTFIVTRAAPTRNEKMVGYMTNANPSVLYIMRWNGASWSNGWNVTVGGAGVNGRRFDIAYSQVTGNAMVVYSNNTTGTNELRYRIWNGASWTAATNLDSARLTGTPNDIKMASRQGSDQIALAVADTANDLTALIWNGSAWGNEPGAAALETNLCRSVAAGDIPSFDIAFESSSGDVLVVNSIFGTNGIKYHQFTGGAWSTATNTTGSANNTFGAVTLSANPDTTSNQILLALTRTVGGGVNIYPAIWSGTAWSALPVTPFSMSATYAVNRLPMAGGWLKSGATTAAVVAHDGSTLNTINYGYSTNGGTSWTAATDGVTVPAVGRWWWDVEMDPGSADTMMATFNDNNADLWAKRLVLSAGPTFTWTDSDGGTALSTTLTNTTTQNFSFAYDRYTCSRRAPSVTFAPTGGTVTPGGNVAYTATVTNNDSSGCGNSTFTLSVPSETGNTGSFTLPSVLGSTSTGSLAPGGTYNTTFTVTAKATASMGDALASTVNAADGTNHVGRTGAGFVTTTVVCVRSAPTVTFNPASGTLPPGGNVPYTVTVTNKDGLGCGNSTFTLSLSDSNSTDFNASTLSATAPNPCTIGPSGTCTATLTVSARAGAVNGHADTTTVSAADATNHNSQTGSGSVNSTIVLACVTANPTVAVNPLGKTVGPGNSVTYTLSVTNNDNAGCAATTFTITKTDGTLAPNFTASTLSATTPNPCTLVSGATCTATLTHTAAASATNGATLQTTVTAAGAGHSNVTSAPVLTTVSTSTCVVGTPSVNIVPASQSVAASGVATYTITVVNNDSATCASATFNFSSSSVPGVPNASFSAVSSPSPASCGATPGTSCSATFTVTATATPANGAAETTTVTVTATGHTNASTSVTTDVNTGGASAGGDGFLLKRSRGETCHGCHKTDSNAPGDPNSIKTHNSTITNSLKWGGNWGVNGASKYGQIACTTCHTAHDTKNILLIKETITTPDGTSWSSSGTNSVSVDLRTYPSPAYPGQAGQSGILGDDSATRANSNKVCEACHSQTNYHKYSQGTLYDHEKAAQLSNCTECHPHKGGFRQAKGCTICHQFPQKNRAAITPQFGGNSHHIQGAAVDDTKCYQCHWAANADGSVNTPYHGGPVNTGAPVRLVVYGAGSRPTTYTVGTTAVEYTSGGSAATPRTELLKINQHCLGCHSAQNNTTQPFGDGKTPNTYAWDGLSVAERYSQPGSTTWGKYPTTTNAAQKNITKAYSAHGNAGVNQRGWDTTNGVDGAITDQSGSVNVLCFDCHNSHGSTVSGTTTSYTSSTTNGAILKSTTAGLGGYTVTYQPAVSGSIANKNLSNPGASLCFDCHMTQTGGTSTPWGYQDTFLATQPIMTYFEKPYWYGGIGVNPAGAQQRYPYKNGIGSSGGHFGASTSLNTGTGGKTINGLCTPCHDPHGVSPTLGANQAYGVPLLKGTWMTSPYKEDAGPASTTEGRGGGQQRNPYGFASTPGYHIDQNTFEAITTSNYTNGDWVWPGTNRITQSDAQFGGLCLSCHAKTDIHPNTTGAWKTYPRIHNAVQGWGGSGGNASNAIHGFPCSKCHTPHNSCLPRLMITNCTDYNHRGQVVSGGIVGPLDTADDTSCPQPGTCSMHGSSGTGNGQYPSGGGGGGSQADRVTSNPPGGTGPWFAPLAGGGSTSRTGPKATLNWCHMVTNAGGNQVFPSGQFWNTKTPW